ncbi:hypothetical protein [Nostoc sp. WHI]|uniref:hypothetical protein n=1 Tax=Nostoc sp. WHI TaxID=2650611 RepID=UPI0018C68DBD|nr:hypothetical protein [Nostoc sp. WHI]
MVRQREFDTDEVLTIIMDLFWQHSYANISMKDIVQATGIQPEAYMPPLVTKRSCFSKL